MSRPMSPFVLTLGLSPKCPTCRQPVKSVFFIRQTGQRLLALWCEGNHRWTLPHPDREVHVKASGFKATSGQGLTMGRDPTGRAV